jgi:Bacteriophage HK97-gp10, putative tail-component
MSVKVTVQNRDKLAAKLKRLAPEVQQAMAAANAQSAQDMMATAQGLAPVRTSTLRNSIHAEPASGSQTSAWRVVAGGPSTTKPSRGGSYDYAMGVEFGTSDTGKVPFFFPSYRLVAKRHRGRVTRAANKAHKAVAAR